VPEVGAEKDEHRSIRQCSVLFAAVALVCGAVMVVVGVLSH